MIRTFLTLAAAAAFLPFGAHAASVSASAHAESPCAVLTPDQIKPLLNGSVTPGVPGGTKESPDCTWRDAKGEDRVYISLKPRDTFNVTRAQMSHTGRLASVTGVGEDAFFVTSTVGSTAYLYALGKHHLLLLQVNIPNASRNDNEAAEKALANAILPKI